MKCYRIIGSTEIIKASCLKQAIRILVTPDSDFQYTPHWYTKSNRLSWAEVSTDYGYDCIVEEVMV